MTSIASKRPVLITGAGPVGMALGIELGIRGVPVILLERRHESDPFPGLVNLVNARSMEHFRRWGIADTLRGARSLPEEVAPSMTFLTRANGHVVFDLAGALAFPEAPPFAVEAPMWAPLPAIDGAMRARIRDLDCVEIRWGVTASGVQAENDGVSVEATTGGEGFHVAGSHLVIAEGRHGALRESLNLRYEVLGSTPAASAWHFRAPGLSALFKAGPSAASMFVNEDRHPSSLMPQGRDGEWLYILTPCPPDIDGDDWEAVRPLLFAAVGAEFEATPIEGGLRGEHFGIVPRADLGRIFLIGDSAQVVPLAGWGMNLGIGDAVDIGWKMAASIAGWGGAQLLEGYGIERGEAKRTLIRSLASAAFSPLDATIRAGLEEEGEVGESARRATAEAIAGDFLKELVTPGGEFGLRYEVSPLIAHDEWDGSPAPQFELAEYRPENRPGARAPHLALEDGSALFDRLGPGFSMVVLGDVSVAEFERAAREAAIPFKVLTVDPDVAAEVGYASALTLVRPDQHVAWRGDVVPSDPRRVLRIATGALM